jgi:hypothetical protein
MTSSGSLRIPLVCLVLAATLLFFGTAAFAQLPAGDVNRSTSVNIIDLQEIINDILFLLGRSETDIDFSGSTNIIDLQIVVNAILQFVIDRDGDGLEDSAEGRIGTDPDIPDTDGDGILDGLELLFGKNPLIPDSLISFSPVVFPVDSPTTDTEVALSGVSLPNGTLNVTGGLAKAEVVVGPTGVFSLDVDLIQNSLNRFFFTGKQNSTQSATSPLEIVQDLEPPDVFIDFPADGAEVTSASIAVAGRVSDMLSGFMGLEVLVNGVAAEVDVGIGTNGTFERTGVPLANGENQITATAMDILGNQSSHSITVTRVPATGATMSIVDGNNQTGMVGSTLTKPLFVELKKSNGDPLANKIVTFEVQRSDGRVSDPTKNGDGSLFYQVRTDENGQAKALLTLGSDSGCGNNRVAVTSRDVSGTTFFCATATPAPATQINVGTGSMQRAEVGAPAPEKLVVWVSDTRNGVGGVPVHFTIEEGTGHIVGADESKTFMVETDVTGRASAEFQLGMLPGRNIVHATFPGNTSAPAVFEIRGLPRSQDGTTSFSGVVLDNGNLPVEGVAVHLEVNGESVPETFSAADGTFELTGIPSGPAHAAFDGSVATAANGEPVAPGTYPHLAFELIIVPDAENSLGTPVFLPTLNPNNEREYDGTEDVELTIEGVEGLSMLVQAGSMTNPDGSTPSQGNPATLSLNQVYFDKIPMPLPDGAASPIAWTLQPGGAHFDPPVQITYPNLNGLPPGAVAYFLSFDHAVNQFGIVASGTVTPDGASIVSDPGVGITVSGWGANCPPYAVVGTFRNCFDVAVAFLGGSPPCPQAFFGLCPEEWHSTEFSQPLHDLRAELREAFPRRIAAQVFDGFTSAEAQLAAVERWVNQLSEQSDRPGDECIRPRVILVGHSLGADSVRLSAEFDFEAEVLIAAEPISRELVIDNFPGVPFYQRDLNLPGASSIILFHAPDTLSPQERINCMDIGFDNFADIECLRGHFVQGASLTTVPSTDHATIIESTAFHDRVIEEVEDVLGLSMPKGVPEPILNETFVLFAGGQRYQMTKDGSFVINNVTGVDETGGPFGGTNFFTDDAVPIAGVGEVDGARKFVFSPGLRFPQGGVAVIDDLTFTDDPPPFPKELDMECETATLAPAETSQFTITGIFFDDSLQDLSTTEDGTTYRVSNPDIIQFDDNGLLTAQSVGFAFAIVSNSGITKVKRMNVATSTFMTTIEGFVFDASGDPVVGTEVTTTSFGGSVNTDANGFFSMVIELPAGTVVVRMQVPDVGDGLQTSPISVVPGGITDAGLIAPEAQTFTTTVEGTVEFEDTSPAEGASVFTNFGGQGFTNASGAFSFEVTGDATAKGLPTLNVTARIQVGDQSFGGTTNDVPVVADGVSDAGVIALVEQANIFLPGARFPMDDKNPDHMTLADVNNDGFEDALVTDEPANDSCECVEIMFGRGDGTFGDPIQLPTGQRPGRTTTGLINGDAHVDILALNRTDGTMSIFLNNGDGTFQPHIVEPCGSLPLGVALADFDKDTNLDAIVANNAVGLSLMTGNGDGTFDDPVPIALTGNLNNLNVVAGDVDEDTNPDILAIVQAQSVVRVLLGNGNGTFGDPDDFATATFPVNAALVDMNNDNDVDIVTSNFAGSASVLLGNGDGTFEEEETFATSGENTTSLAVGFIDGDNNRDVVVLNESGVSNKMSVFLGNGDGSLQGEIAIPYSRFLRDIGLTDTDQDGLLDIVGSTGSFFAEILVIQGIDEIIKGNSGDYFYSQRFLGDRGERDVVLEDVNGDEKPDLLALDFIPAGFVVSLGNGDGTFNDATSFETAARPLKLVIVDLNNDQKPDACIMHQNSANDAQDGVSVLLGNGDGTFQEFDYFQINGTPVDIAVVDVDLDTKPDLITVKSPNGFGADVRLGVGDGTFGAPNAFAVPGQAEGLAVKDINKDNNPDLIMADTTSNNVAVMLGLGNGGFQSATTLLSGDAPYRVAVDDVNNDTNQDIIAMNLGDNTVAVFLGNGDATFQDADLFPTRAASGIDPGGPKIADINNDGSKDLLFTSQILNGVQVMLGDGTGAFSFPILFDAGQAGWDVDVADINGDGAKDVAQAAGQGIAILLQK